MQTHAISPPSIHSKLSSLLIYSFIYIWKREKNVDSISYFLFKFFPLNFHFCCYFNCRNKQIMFHYISFCIYTLLYACLYDLWSRVLIFLALEKMEKWFFLVVLFVLLFGLLINGEMVMAYRSQDGSQE